MELPQKAVTCDCPGEFVLAILTTIPGSVEMAACCRCGRADLANPLTSEDRPHDVQFHGYAFFELTDEARAWASAWPRYVWSQSTSYKSVYLAASARFTSVAELNDAVAVALVNQAGASLREKLLALGVPSSEPPPSLPKQLSGFAEFWHALQMNDSTPLNELLDAATRFNGPNQLAADVLKRRSDLHPLAIGLLSDIKEKRRRYGRYLIEQFKLEGEDILEAVRKRLREVRNDDKSGELNGLCVILKKMGRAAVSAIPDLEFAAEGVKDSYYDHREVMELVACLQKYNSPPNS
jgi:hypothetical protein